MREHMGLYKGKRLDNGEWIYGSLINNIEGAVPCIVTTPSIDDACRLEFEYCYVNPDTVGECTGQPDANGKLIFEGDILDRDGTYCVVVWCAEECRFVVVFSICGVKYENIVVKDQLKKLNVIGNIHDKPELLGWRLE